MVQYSQKQRIIFGYFANRKKVPQVVLCMYQINQRRITMNNVITNGKASISDWTNFHYEKKSISKERNITLYKRMKKRFLVFDIVMPFNSGFLVAAIILWVFCNFDKILISYVLILSVTVIVNAYGLYYTKKELKRIQSNLKKRGQMIYEQNPSSETSISK